MQTEKCTCEKCEGYQKYLAWKAKQPKQLDPERMGELLGDYERDKRHLAKELETDPIHDHMIREVVALKEEAANWRDEHVRREAAEPTVASTYTKSYVSAPFGTEGSPLQLVTLKRGLEELAVIPASLIFEMFTELREDMERYRMDHKPDTRHRFAPNKKYPWFCAHCGYPPEHPVMHLPQDADRGGASESQRKADGMADGKPDGQAENVNVEARDQ
jgi:hypothetical protein